MQGKPANIPLIIVGYILLAISLAGLTSIPGSGIYPVTLIWFVVALIAIGLLWRGAPARYPRHKTGGWRCGHGNQPGSPNR